MNLSVHIASALVCFVALLPPPAYAANVNTTSETVNGVTLVSAELVQQTDDSGELLVVRLRNDGASAGQTVSVATTVYDSSGAAKRGGSNRIEVTASPGSEQLVSRRIAGTLESDDSIAVELVDAAAATSGSPDSSNVCAGGECGATTASAPCTVCEWCYYTAKAACGVDNVKSVSCNCQNGSCSFECP